MSDGYQRKPGGGGGGGPAEPGVTDHGDLDGLTDPDHPIAAVSGLQAALDGKSGTAHAHASTDVTFTPVGNISATSAGGAIAELEQEKAPIGHEHDANYDPLGAAAAITKTSIGLGNVDNTADAAKPVSTAQATADALKLAKASNLSDLADVSTALTNLGLSTFFKTLLDDANAAAIFATLGISAYVQTLLNDADAATARSTLGAEGLLAAHAYLPGSNTTLLTTSSTTVVDVDATNAAITFTVPASGKVLVVLEAMGDCDVSTTTYWGVRESTTILASAWVGSQGATGSVVSTRHRVGFHFTGLTPGDVKTYKFACGADAGAGSARVYAGNGSPAYGPLNMEVWASNPLA